MNDLETRIRDAFQGHEGEAPMTDLADARGVAGRTRRRQAWNVAGVGIGALVVAVVLTAGFGQLVGADRTPASLDRPSPSISYEPDASEPPGGKPRSILDGEVTFSASPRWKQSFFGAWALWLDDNLKERIHVLANPLPGCDAQGPAPADASALAQSIGSDPDLVTSAPVTVQIGGVEALQMDVVAAPGADDCGGMYGYAPGVVVERGQENGSVVVETGKHRMRLILVDLPDGLSAQMMAIAIVAPEARFEQVAKVAQPVLESLEFHTSTPVAVDTPAPSDLMRQGGEVLRYTGRTEPDILPDGTTLEPMPGDLVAVDPSTGEERVLVENPGTLYSARWSGDGRWLAYETDAEGGRRALWVAGGQGNPRLMATSGAPLDPSGSLDWQWSPTGAVLATIEDGGVLRTTDVATGKRTDFGAVVADLLPARAALPWPWTWSPDGSRLVFGSPWGEGGTIYAVDARSGARSVLASMPGSIERIRWSPDGSHIAVQARMDDGGHLYTMDADGSDVRLVADDSDSLGFAWSPDGTQLAFGTKGGRMVRVQTATSSGAVRAEIGTFPGDACARSSWGAQMECAPTWSPDGTQVAFRSGDTGEVIVFDAAGTGGGEPSTSSRSSPGTASGTRAPVW